MSRCLFFGDSPVREDSLAVGQSSDFLIELFGSVRKRLALTRTRFGDPTACFRLHVAPPKLRLASHIWIALPSVDSGSQDLFRFNFVSSALGKAYLA